MAERQFWFVMHYACDRCGHEVPFYLEDGCEGPRDRVVPLPKWGEAQLRRAPGEIRRTHPGTVPQTNSGLYVLPVPFVAAGCPTCQPRTPWDPTSGVLSHVEWHRDRAVDTTDPPGDAGLMLYPDDPTETGACGHPVLPGERGLN